MPTLDSLALVVDEDGGVKEVQTRPFVDGS